MAGLLTLFQDFLKERQFLEDVTPKTLNRSRRMGNDWRFGNTLRRANLDGAA